MTSPAATETAPLPSVTAIVVAADSGAVLSDCVAALLACPQITAVHLHDNASRDGLPQQLAQQHAHDARLRLHRSDRNLGFGAAVNRVAAGLDGRWLLVVNPDVVLQAQDLARLLHTAEVHADCGVVGALMVDAHGHVDPASRRRDPLLGRTLAKLGLGRGEGVDQSPPTAGEAVPVDNISGALMLLRRRMFQQLGGFDEGYFLHFEDLDLCRRLRAAGHGVWLDGGAQVVHQKGSSSHHRPLFVARHKHRGMWRWFKKHDPLATHGYWRAAVFAAIWAHFAMQAPRLLWRRSAR